MKQQTSPLPNPGDWATKTGAATLLGVTWYTVNRMIADGRLTAYAPIGARNAEHLLWVPELTELVAARKRVAVPAAPTGPYCVVCGDPVTVDGLLHVWSGRAGLPERPYEHPARMAERA